jgi:hypothetical protein
MFQFNNKFTDKMRRIKVHFLISVSWVCFLLLLWSCDINVVVCRYPFLQLTRRKRLSRM